MACRTLSLKRMALIVSVAALLAAFALPAAAMAKTTTRILVTSTATSVTKVVNWSDPSTIPASPAITAKLQKKTSTGWKTLKGTIYVYLNDASSSSLTSFRRLYKSGSTATSLKWTLAARGKYKFYYPGNSTYKPATGYATRLDNIGETITPVTRSVVRTDATWSTVTLEYQVNWNASAYPFDNDAPLYLHVESTFENADQSFYSGTVDFDQDFWVPQSVLVTFRVLNSDIDAIDSPNLDTWASVRTYDGSYLSTQYTRSRFQLIASTPYPTTN